MLFTKCPLMAAVALFLSLSCMPMFTSALVKTAKKLNESAILSCNVTCPGVMQWRRNGEVVAECGPGATNFSFICQINLENTLLTVPLVNFSSRGYYSAFCSGQERSQCRQFLQLIPPEDFFVLDAGDRLELDLRVHDPVIVEFTEPGSSSTVELCRMDGRRRQCRAEYEQRIFIVGNSLVLMDIKPSDSGNYSIRDDARTLVSSSNITVTETSSRVQIPPKPERERHDLKHFLINSTVNGVCTKGYQKGMVAGVLAAGFLGLICIIVFFFLGMHFGLKLHNSCSENLRIADFSHEDQSKDKDILLTSPNGSIQSSKV